MSYIAAVAKCPQGEGAGARCDCPNGPAMQGLMQEWPLTLNRIIEHAAKWHGDREIVSPRPDGSLERTSYAEVNVAARRFSSALLSLGIKPGDRVATMAMN